MTDAPISEEELAELVRRTEEATTAFVSGDMDRYIELTPHITGFTLMNPFGGPPNRYEDRTESLREAADYFKGGEARLEVAEAHAWGDTQGRDIGQVDVYIRRLRVKIDVKPESRSAHVQSLDVLHAVHFERRVYRAVFH